MITFTRSQAWRLGAVMRSALYGRCRPRPSHPVHFRADHGGLSVHATTDTVVLQSILPSQSESGEITVPWKLLTDCGGRDDGPVQIEASGGGEVLACWESNAVPQLARYSAPDPPAVIPAPPARFTSNPPRLLMALRDATQTADVEAARFALDHIQLRGNIGEIVATDGRQLLVQRGFEFPWDHDVLVPGNAVFSSKEFNRTGHVRIGSTADWVCIQFDHVSLFLQIASRARFPDALRCLPDPRQAIAGVQIGEDDAEFLMGSLKSLPCGDDYNKPVTIDLNGCVVVRATSSERTAPVELALSDTRCQGTEVRFQTNRRFLERAVRLGFRTLQVFAANQPLLCVDNQRSYLWALLDPDGAIKPSPEAVHIGSTHTRRPRPRQRRRQQHRVSTVVGPLAATS